jgi:hypothetical protein
MIGHYLSNNNEKRYSSISQKVSGTKQPLGLRKQSTTHHKSGHEANIG